MSLQWFHIFCFFIILISRVQHHLCSDTRFHKQVLFSTKTPYFWERDYNETVEEDSESFYDSSDSTKSCQVFHLNSFVRHGIRYPGLKWIKRMTNVHKKLLETDLGENLDFIKEWVNQFPTEKEHELADLGESELFGVGRNYGKRFKLLFEGETDRLKYYVSSKQRTFGSSLAFHEGLMENFPSEDSYEDDMEDPVPIVDDIILRFHANCKKYYHHIENNETALGEYLKFKSGPDMTNLVHTVSKTMTGSPDTLNTDEVLTIHQICAFELSFFEKSDWCQFFNEDHMSIIDYLNDLKHYWQKAYGYKLSSDMSCPLIQHTFTEMDNALKDFTDAEDYTVGLFHFAHAETLAPMYAALGLYRDKEPLMADNYSKHTDRLFRSSKILPFAANIAFALYECDTESDRGKEEDEEDEEDEEENIHVRLFVNEKAINIPACGHTICRYSDVRQYYSDLIDNCKFDEICEVDTNHSHDEL